MRAVIYLALIIILLFILVLISGVATASAPSGKMSFLYANAMQWCVVGGGALLIEAFLSMKKQMVKDGAPSIDIFKWNEC